jgi:hypothetical protein
MANDRGPVKGGVLEVEYLRQTARDCGFVVGVTFSPENNGQDPIDVIAGRNNAVNSREPEIFPKSTREYLFDKDQVVCARSFVKSLDCLGSVSNVTSVRALPRVIEVQCADYCK